MHFDCSDVSSFLFTLFLAQVSIGVVSAIYIIIIRLIQQFVKFDTVVCKHIKNISFKANSFTRHGVAGDGMRTTQTWCAVFNFVHIDYRSDSCLCFTRHFSREC